MLCALKKSYEGIFTRFSFLAIDCSDDASLSLVYDEYDMLIAGNTLCDDRKRFLSFSATYNTEK